MTKQEWLARCDAAWETGKVSEESLLLMRQWCELVERFLGGQLDICWEILASERERTSHFQKKLAGDDLGCGVVQLTSQLAHHCQRCAEDPDAWHTRASFCNHKKPAATPSLPPGWGQINPAPNQTFGEMFEAARKTKAYNEEKVDIAEGERAWWICGACGREHGKYLAWVSTWHDAVCGWCNKYKAVTECRDFGLEPKVAAPPVDKEKLAKAYKEAKRAQDRAAKRVDSGGKRKEGTPVGVSSVRTGSARHRARAKPRRSIL